MYCIVRPSHQQLRHSDFTKSDRCVYFLILGSVLLRSGQVSLEMFDLKSLYKLGFGAFNYSSVIHGKSTPTGLTRSVLLANLPQVLLSFLYLNYNGLLTCLLESYEWSLFSKKRRPLRVTSPKGKQRSTWFLELPYSHSVVSYSDKPHFRKTAGII
jgi:hypothetical protein